MQGWLRTCRFGTCSFCETLFGECVSLVFWFQEKFLVANFHVWLFFEANAWESLYIEARRKNLYAAALEAIHEQREERHFQQLEDAAEERQQQISEGMSILSSEASSEVAVRHNTVVQRMRIKERLIFVSKPLTPCLSFNFKDFGRCSKFCVVSVQRLPGKGWGCCTWIRLPLCLTLGLGRSQWWVSQCKIQWTWLHQASGKGWGHAADVGRSRLWIFRSQRPEWCCQSSRLPTCRVSVFLYCIYRGFKSNIKISNIYIYIYIHYRT